MGFPREITGNRGNCMIAMGSYQVWVTAVTAGVRGDSRDKRRNTVGAVSDRRGFLPLPAFPVSVEISAVSHGSFFFPCGFVLAPAVPVG